MNISRISSNDVVSYGQVLKSENKTDFSNILDSTMNNSGADLDRIFEEASEKYGVPVNLLKAVAKTESNFNSNATSSCGAMGVMQLMPGTAKSLGVTDAYDAEQNIMGGAKYLSSLLKEFDGNTELAVAAYNAGPGNVEKYNEVPPFAETQKYVERVMGYYGDNSNINVQTENVNSLFTSIPGAAGEINSGDDTGNNAEILASIMQLNMQMKLFETIRKDQDKTRENLL